MMLYGTTSIPAAAIAGELFAVDSPRLFCPKDSPVDIYSVTIPEYVPNGATNQIIYILDGNERPFWDSQFYNNMIDVSASAISFGYGGVRLDPDETIRVELENGDPTVITDLHVVVTYRGVLEVLEVEDGR
jgi:hypothetical protein